MDTFKLRQLSLSIKQGFAVGTVALLPFTFPLANAADQSDLEQMETIVVTAQALKVETPAQETPKSVSIITEEELKTRAPQKLDEALRYTSGVTAQPYGSDNDTDWFKVRGFDAATYLDGNRLFRDGYYTWLLEPYGLQQVEVIKGPSAILFGEAPSGGVVNAVQKKPTYTPQGEVKVEVGNNNAQSIGFDISDEANESGSMRYRLVGLMKSADGELDHSESERFYLAPSLEIDISDRTMLTLMATYLKDDGTPTNGFFPAAGTLIDSDFGKIDPSTNLGEPGYDTYERTQISVGYLLEHDYNDTWSLSQNLNYGYNDLLLRSVYAFPNSDPTASELARGVVFRDGHNQSITMDNNAVASWFSDRSEHTALIGVDLQYHETEGEEQDSFAFSSINPWNPDYGNYTPLDPANNIDRKITKSQASIYSQYQIKFDSQWIGLVGARYDWGQTENKSIKGDQDESRDDGQLSLNAGAMYLAENGLSPYASYAQSFEVLSTIDPSTGKLYKPLEGDQVEVGVKYEPSFMDGYVNLAWFDITQKNALVTNPNTFVATQTGELTSSGIEVETVSQVTKSIKVSAAYTYTDAKTDDTGGQGKKQAGLIPEHAASAWVDYNASLAGIQGLNIGTGVRYIGESKDSPASSNLTVPSATLWDAAVTYDITSQWQAQLNVNNIFDEEYVSGCDYYCYYGQSRTVMLNANYRW
ncbi:TonB-dependent siderophore receptor [Photobacterium frigidiphilum]|uniref:TonB-dependent siderophore receptor n=1 Tax=Photobacterium frigidiphilum TaxID=264736 RepID=A0A2T3JM52_9GAMM|nr:TonB-dependent siderophore receptor [Photobacterium frigidiphilum]PSU50109.1 TonB-dependent siderophore receptor [Photobacterium frigidiphilum]